MTADWRNQGVKVVRAASLSAAMSVPSAGGRATALGFAGGGGRATWIGTVTMAPNSATGSHHHGRHEVAVYVVRGRGEIRWGDRLDFAAKVSPGDFVYFAPFVPHQELNLESGETLEFVVVRSDGERIATPIDVVPATRPEYLVA